MDEIQRKNLWSFEKHKHRLQVPEDMEKEIKEFFVLFECVLGNSYTLKKRKENVIDYSCFDHLETAWKGIFRKYKKQIIKDLEKFMDRKQIEFEEIEWRAYCTSNPPDLIPVEAKRGRPKKIR